jgi:hypothetical protein
MAAPALALVPARVSLREHIAETDALIDIIEQLDEADELTPGVVEQLQKELIGAIAGTKAKVDTTAAVLARFEAEEAFVQSEEKRLKARREWLGRQRERLSDYVIATLTSSGLKKIDGTFSSLAVRSNPPAVQIDAEVLADPERLGWDFLRLPEPAEPQVDRVALKKALAAGAHIEGVCLTQSIRLVRS